MFKNGNNKKCRTLARIPGPAFHVWVIIGFLIVLPASTLRKTSPGVDHMIGYFKSSSSDFARSVAKLRPAIIQLKNNDSGTLLRARQALLECRLQYKRIEFLMEYFFQSSALVYNAPAKIETEEPEMAFVEPVGLQVIEAYLFEPDVEIRREQLLAQCDVVYSSAKDINSLLYNFSASDAEVMESIQLALIRVITLTITGFDAPLLKSGIQESFESVRSIAIIAGPYLNSSKNADSLKTYLSGAQSFLHKFPDFDSFDRLYFLTEYALPLQKCLNSLIIELHLELNTSKVLHYNAGNIFAPGALNISAFGEQSPFANPAKVALGKTLFFEPALSGNGLKSCASCHQPDRHFTDGETTSLAFDGHSTIKRNAPSVLYAGFQYGQFWDGRANSLEEQVAMVMASKDEMNADTTAMLRFIKNDSGYTRLFKKAFSGNGVEAMNVDHIGLAIASYIRTLNPLNAAFDRYLAGDRKAMTGQQVRGFNLFMGKAQCGTCHFAPLFNGTMPPYYVLTELEVLGLTKNEDFAKPVADTDNGRYNVFPIEFNRQAFKTPTVRNAAVTAPYMHNGAFKTLKTVMDFYNKGGGNGIGLQVPNQTLSSLPLGLTEEEIDSIISFMEALTDRLE